MADYLNPSPNRSTPPPSRHDRDAAREERLEAMADQFLDLLGDLITGRKFISFTTTPVNLVSVTTIEISDNASFVEPPK